MTDFIVSLDFLAAIITLFYICKLLFQAAAGQDSKIYWNDLRTTGFEKRSLLNQHIVARS